MGVEVVPQGGGLGVLEVRVAGDDHLVVLVRGGEQGLREAQRLGHDEEQRPAVRHPDAGRLLVDPAAGSLDVEPGRAALVLEVPLELQGDRADFRVAGQQFPRFVRRAA